MPQAPCPYCGQLQDSIEEGRCSSCNGLFEPLSRIATQLAMGPWYIRDEDRPFMPGFSEEILRQQVAAGRISANTILRGPTTNQFWMSAGDVPGVSRLMGTCHACHQEVEPTDTTCYFCKEDMSLPSDVDSLGLKYTTEETRAQAQQEIAQGRANPPSKPAAKPTPKPVERPALKGSTIVEPDKMQPVEANPAAPIEPETPPQENEAYDEAEAYDDGNELASELAEDVWHAGPATPTRRRKKHNGADPLALGMGVVLLCVVALGLLILLTSGTKDEEPVQEQTQTPVVQRDSVAVSRISVPAITAFERLVPDEIPSEFEEQYAAIRRLKQQAEADKEAERYNEAFDAYKELGELVGPLETEIAQWQANELAKTEANELRNRVSTIRQQAQDAEAERWAGKEWLEGQAAWDQVDALITSSQFIEATEILNVAESVYLTAENKAQAGQLASKARNALNDAVQNSGSEQRLRQFANDQIDEMLRLRAEGDGQLNEQQYAAAEQSYNSALDALNDAKEAVELARFRKFYAFDAGFRASSLMLSAARGDGVDSSAKSELVKAFEKLRILPNPASGIMPGEDVGFTVAIQPLVNDARDQIIQQHGEAVQACYLIGFHASIVDQTLRTTALTDDQQKRIHQSLSTIETEASKAGWDLNALRPVVEQVRNANRKAKLKEAPEATLSAWKRMLFPMQSRDSAPRLMDPDSSPSTPDDPELFPVGGASSQ
ncbi:MAG: hypothetical protein AAGB26_03975 [Planctomycetota bacterium]